MTDPDISPEPFRLPLDLELRFHLRHGLLTGLETREDVVFSNANISKVDLDGLSNRLQLINGHSPNLFSF